MAKLDYFDVDQSPEPLREALTGRSRLAIFRMIANANAAAPHVLKLGKSLSDESRLDPMLRELVVLRVGHVCQAEYEYSRHARRAVRLGVPEAKVAAVVDFPATQHLFAPFEIDLLCFTDCVITDAGVPPELFEVLRNHFDDGQIVELMLQIGFYVMVCRIMTNLDVEIEADEEGMFFG